MNAAVCAKQNQTMSTRAANSATTTATATENNCVILSAMFHLAIVSAALAFAVSALWRKSHQWQVRSCIIYLHFIFVSL